MSLAESDSRSPSAAERPRRADALRNRDRVIAAAGEIFALAGVGKATVYRSFPSKEHLVAAVACERLRWVAEQVTEALLRPDAGRAFEEVVIAIAERQASD